MVLALGAFMPSASHAQSGVKQADMKAMETAKPAQGPVHKGVGVVRKVDPARSTVTLAHERIASLSWPPMVMAFSVKDKALLDKARAGRKVEFEFVQQGMDNVITSLK
jgi:Cu/Ag efflux protein CusF